MVYHGEESSNKNAVTGNTEFSCLGVLHYVCITGLYTLA